MPADVDPNTFLYIVTKNIDSGKYRCMCKEVGNLEGYEFRLETNSSGTKFVKIYKDGELITNREFYYSYDNGTTWEYKGTSYSLGIYSDGQYTDTVEMHNLPIYENGVLWGNAQESDTITLPDDGYYMVKFYNKTSEWQMLDIDTWKATYQSKEGTGDWEYLENITDSESDYEVPAYTEVTFQLLNLDNPEAGIVFVYDPSKFDCYLYSIDNNGSDIDVIVNDSDKPIRDNYDEGFWGSVLYTLDTIIYYITLPFTILMTALNKAISAISNVFNNFKTSLSALISIFSLFPYEMQVFISLSFAVGIILVIVGRR